MDTKAGAREGRAWLAAALACATVLAYGPALGAGFVWDDDAHVVAGTGLTDAEGLRRIWLEPGVTQQYYPVVYTSFWVEQRVWGENPRGYHGVNVALHAANALLLGLLLRRLSVPGAWLAAALFALHPVHVESVAWISERKNVLSTALYLLAALSYLRFSEGGETPRRALAYAASLLLFVAALLSKTVVATLPAALLLLAWWKRGRITRADVTPLLPFFAIGAALGLLTLVVEKRMVGAFGPEFELGAVERVLVAGRACWFYLGKLLWPANLTFIYPRWHIDAGGARLFAYPLLALALVVALWIARPRIGRGPLAAVLFFGGTLFPALGFFDVYPFRFSYVADHFQYLASAGILALLAAGLARLARWSGGHAGARAAAVVLVGLLLAGLARLTGAQAATYRDARTLWETTLERNPRAWIAHHNLGVEYYQAGERERGLAMYDRAIELNPDYADAYNNRGLALLERGEVERAIEDFSRAIESQSDHLMALTNRGSAYHRIGRSRAMLADFARVVELAPDDTRARLNLAIAHAQIGRDARAVAGYTRVIDATPEDGQAHWRRCQSLRRLGRHAEALLDCDRAVALDPRDGWAYLARAKLLLEMGQPERARHDAATARRLGAVVGEGSVSGGAVDEDG